MTTFSIDSRAQGLRATGIVEPVFPWVEDPATGRRSQGKDQDRTDAGVPLWAVEVSRITESYGRQSTTVARVTVPAATQPSPAAFDLIDFDRLVVAVSVTKTGQMREYWSADALTAKAKATA